MLVALHTMYRHCVIRLLKQWGVPPFLDSYTFTSIYRFCLSKRIEIQIKKSFLLVKYETFSKQAKGEGYQSKRHMIILHTRFGQTQGHLNVTIIMGRFIQILFWIYIVSTKRSEMVFFSKCLEISVNVEQVREVFVTNCRVNKVIVTGDTARFTISIKDTNGLNCGN